MQKLFVNEKDILILLSIDRRLQKSLNLTKVRYILHYHYIYESQAVHADKI